MRSHTSLSEPYFKCFMSVYCMSLISILVMEPWPTPVLVAMRIKLQWRSNQKVMICLIHTLASHICDRYCHEHHMIYKY